MKKLSILFLLVYHCSLASAQNKADTSYDIYCNPRYGYCIKYPPGQLIPQPVADNGDGRIFTDKKNRNVLFVYGCRNVDVETDIEIPFLQQYKADLKPQKSHPNRKIVYSKFAKTYYVITGTEGKDIFYEKVILLPDGAGHAAITYPESERSIYDEVSKQIFLSFKELK